MEEVATYLRGWEINREKEKEGLLFSFLSKALVSNKIHNSILLHLGILGNFPPRSPPLVSKRILTQNDNLLQNHIGRPDYRNLRPTAESRRVTASR